jgi:sigma-B regulation protein RsbU (phosphoserine phosphatase)
MVRELEIASEVQRTLLPRVIPVLPRLEVYGTVLQGTFVGGDYIDFLKLSESGLRVVIADVSGKGVPAALIMAEVRASTHLLTGMHLPLDELAAQLNTLVRTSTDNRVFVTYLAVDIDTTSGMLSYVNAGHPRAYVHFSGSIVPLSTRTFALGALEALPQLSVNTLPFQPGSTLVAYTDGIFEYADAGGEQYGEERLRQAILTHASSSAESIARALLADVRAFGAMRPFDDDAALAIVRHA